MANNVSCRPLLRETNLLMPLTMPPLVLRMMPRTLTWGIPRSRLLLAAFLVGISGCELPTSAPRFDTTWEIVVARDSVRTTDLLPDEMSLDERGFVLDSFLVEESVRLDQVCELCTCFQGPIPELELVPTEWRFQLPAGLFSAPIEGGRASLELTNRMGFDLLDNGQGVIGLLRVELVDTRFQDSIVARQDIRSSFPVDSTLVIGFDLAGIELRSTLVARVSGTTPGSTCENLSLDPADGLDAIVRLDNIFAREAQVFLSDADLFVAPREVDLSSFVGDRLRPGEADLSTRVRIESSIPAGVELNLSLANSAGALHGPLAALTTPVDLPAGSTAAPSRFDRSFVLDVADLEGATTLHFATRNRVAGSRLVTLRGAEQVLWEVSLRAVLPSR